MADGWVVVDLHGGTMQVAAGTAGQKGVAVLVVEPIAKSVLTARRFVEMRRVAARAAPPRGGQQSRFA